MSGTDRVARNTVDSASLVMCRLCRDAVSLVLFFGEIIPSAIFTGDKLLTTANPEFDEDTRMFEQLGLKGLKPNAVKSMEGRVTSADWVNPSAPTQAVAAS